MPDMISRKAAIAEIDEYLHGLDSCISEPDLKLDGYKNGLQVAIQELMALPAVDAVPIKPLCAWLAGYAAPPAYTIGGMPYKHEDAARRRAEGWEQHIHTLVECGLIDEGEQNA